MSTTNDTRPTKTVTPHLVCSDASAAIDFYQRAFGAVERFRLAGPDGNGIMHACIQIGDSPVFLVDENAQWGSFSPKSLKGTPVTIHLQVENVDDLYAQAIAAGGTVKMSPADMFWGDRYGILLDPFGHQWSIATHKQHLTPEQIAENAKAMFPSPDCQ
jgi:PhnB protein